MHSTLAAAVIGGTLDGLAAAAADASHRHTGFLLGQAEALGCRLGPRAYLPADLVTRQVLQEVAAQQRLAAAGPAAAPAAAATPADYGGGDFDNGGGGGGDGGGVDGPLDCLEACCLNDDLHLFRCAPAGGLLLPACLPAHCLPSHGPMLCALLALGMHLGLCPFFVYIDTSLCVPPPRPDYCSAARLAPPAACCRGRACRCRCSTKAASSATHCGSTSCQPRWYSWLSTGALRCAALVTLTSHIQTVMQPCLSLTYDCCRSAGAPPVAGMPACGTPTCPFWLPDQVWGDLFF